MQSSAHSHTHMHRVEVQWPVWGQRGNCCPQYALQVPMSSTSTSARWRNVASFRNSPTRGLSTILNSHVGQAERGFPALNPWPGHTRVGEWPHSKMILSPQAPRTTSHSPPTCPGEHHICLHSNSTRMALLAGSKSHVHLDILIGKQSELTLRLLLRTRWKSCISVSASYLINWKDPEEAGLPEV
jgi:hypothetical protein